MFFRNYDAALRRWVGVDPVAESAESMTPYQYAGNNPVMFNDPLGDVLRAPPPSVNDTYDAASAQPFNSFGTGGGGNHLSTGLADELSSNGAGAWGSRFAVSLTGNVGIGTTTPGAVLDVGALLSPGTLGTVLARLAEGNTTGAGTYLGIKGYNTQLNGNITNPNDVVSFSIEHSFYGVTNSSINFLRGGALLAVVYPLIPTIILK